MVKKMKRKKRVRGDAQQVAAMLGMTPAEVMASRKRIAKAAAARSAADSAADDGPPLIVSVADIRALGAEAAIKRALLNEAMRTPNKAG